MSIAPSKAPRPAGQQRNRSGQHAQRHDDEMRAQRRDLAGQAARDQVDAERVQHVHQHAQHARSATARRAWCDTCGSLRAIVRRAAQRAAARCSLVDSRPCVKPGITSATMKIAADDRTPQRDLHEELHRLDVGGNHAGRKRCHTGHEKQHVQPDDRSITTVATASARLPCCSRAMNTALNRSPPTLPSETKLNR